jgi:hypothetical protein
MRKYLTLALAGASAALGGTIGFAQDAAGEQQTYTVGEFERVSAVGPQHVRISVGPARSVRASGPHETLAKLEAVVEDGELRIRPKPPYRRDMDWLQFEPVTFHVALPRLAAASLTGSGDMTVDRVVGSDFSAAVAGSGGLAIDSLAVDSARFAVAGSGNVTVRGRARDSHISIAGSGDVQARDVTSATASISIVGSGSTALTVNDEARVSIIGSGDADIAGPARCSVSRMGRGGVTCGNVERARRQS